MFGDFVRCLCLQVSHTRCWPVYILVHARHEKGVLLHLCPGFARFYEYSLHRVGQLVGMRQQQRYLPHLRRRKMLIETRHASEPDTVRDLPIRLAGLIVGDALPFKKMRWARKFALSNGGLLFSRNAMADSTMLHVDVSTRKQIHFVCWNGHLSRHLPFQSSMQGHPSECLLERHWCGQGCNRRDPGREVDVDNNGNAQNCNDDSEYKSFHPSLRELRTTNTIA